MKKKALVVIEESGTRNLVVAIAEGMGFTIDTVSDGLAAFVLLSSLLIGRYDVVFLDAHMAGWDGLDILGYHEEKRGKRNIVIVTDFDVGSTVDEHPNVLRVLRKPIRSGDIVSCIANFITE